MLYFDILFTIDINISYKMETNMIEKQDYFTILL